MKKIYPFILALLCTTWAMGQDAAIRDKLSPDTASIGVRTAIRTEIHNIGTAPTPSFTLYYYINEVN